MSFITKRFAPFFLVVSIVFNFGSTFAAAQTEDLSNLKTPERRLPSELPQGVLKCFDHYRFGSVQANVPATISQTSAGALISFSGTVTNENSYPITQGKLSVKIFREDDKTFADSDGHALVDYFVIEDDIVLDGNAKKEISYTWRVPDNAPKGKYYAAYFFTTSDRYNLMGLSFTDDVVGNIAPFSVATEQENTLVYLSKTDTKINGIDHKFANFPLHFDAADSVVITTTITNPSDTEKMIPLQWNQYGWDAQNEANNRHTKTELITLAPQETKTLSYEVTQARDAVVFVTAIAQDQGSKSLLHVRYVRDGVEETRINFPSITKFPLKQGDETTLFACAHSTNLPLVSDNELTLTLTDRDGQEIKRFTYKGDIPGAMAGFGETFAPDKDYDYVQLTASLYRQGALIEEVTVVYDCEVINPQSCLPKTALDSTIFDFIKELPTIIWIAIAAALAVLAGLFWFIKRNPKEHIIVPAILFALFFGFGSGIAEAKSVSGVYLMGVGNIGYRAGSTAAPCQFYSSDNFWADVNTSQLTMTFVINAYNNSTNQLISENDTVPAGTVVRFEVDTSSNANINWFLSGTNMDSPNGVWVDALPTVAQAACVNTSNPAAQQTLYVQRPTLNFDHSGSSASATCNANGSLCTVTTAGTLSTFVRFTPINTRFTGNGVYGVDLGGGWSWGFGPYDSTYGNGTPWFPHIETTYPINVSGTIVPTNAAPNPPTISGPATGLINTSYPYNFVSTDPDNDNVRYGVDWDNNGTVDEWVPSSGHVSSGSNQSTNHSWATASGYTFQALAQDNQGNSSGWSSYSVTITTPPPPTADLKINSSDGPLSVNKNTAATVSWASANAGSSCIVSGAGIPGGTQSVGSSGSLSVTINLSDTYTLVCGLAGDSVAVTAVNQAPNAPAIVGPTSAGGGDTNTFTITGTDPDNDQIFYEIDWDNDGGVDVTSPGVGYVTSGTSVSPTRSWLASGSYTFRVRVVDNENARSAWTSHTITITNSVPATATLEAQVNGGAWSTSDQTVNPSDSVTVRWSSTNATSCSGTGGGFSTSNNTSGTDGVNTPAPNSTDTFTVNCTGVGGSNSDSLTITTRQLPNFTTPLITYNLGSFDTLTSTYNSVQVVFQTSNNGGSDTAVSANYQFQFDRGSNGYDVNTTGSLGLLAVSASVNRTETVNNIPLGNNRIQVTVDSNNAVAEVSEADNVMTLDIIVPPPNPGLNITADRTQVRSGETVQLSWTVGIPYAMSCRVSGPGITTYSFDPSINGQSAGSPRPSGAITAKSEYTLSCTEPITGTIFTDNVIIEAQGAIEEI